MSKTLIKARFILIWNSSLLATSGAALAQAIRSFSLMPARSALACLAFTVLTTGTVDCARAQVRPDAGALQQQIDRGRMQSLPPGTGLERPVAPPPALTPQAGGAMITVKSFRFAGNRLIEDDRLSQVVADYLNRPLTFAELQEAATAVANAYREAGWIVRAYLPRQDVSGGIVTIAPGKGGFGTFSPPLDEAGNSVRGQRASRYVSERLGLNIFASKPVEAPLLGA